MAETGHPASGGDQSCAAPVVRAYLALQQERPTRHGPLTEADLRRMVDETRAPGWSLNDEELTEGVTSVGAAVRGGTGAALCALSVAGLAAAYRGERRDRIAAAVTEAADALSRRITGR